MNKLKLQIPMHLDDRALDTISYMDAISDFSPDVKIIGVTGASGSGKDSFVEAIQKLMPPGTVRHLRFGDVMKDMAHKFGMVPHPKEYYEQNRDARFELLPNGKTALDAWIALDVIREYNPYVFTEITLKQLLSDLEWNWKEIQLIVFSGMRTEAGLTIVDMLADKTFRIERPNHAPPAGATLDSLQVEWPVQEIINNDKTLGQLEKKAYKVLEELWKKN